LAAVVAQVLPFLEADICVRGRRAKRARKGRAYQQRERGSIILQNTRTIKTIHNAWSHWRSLLLPFLTYAPVRL